MISKKIIIYFFLFFVLDCQAQVWMSKNTKIFFYSYTPIENIEAVNDQAVGAMNIKSGKIYFKAMMKSFKFEKALMQEHFNENYVESHKYPSSEYSGIIQELPDLTQDGTYFVVIKGALTVHGISVNREVKATLVVKGDKIEAKCFLKVPCHDHNIQIPKVSRKNISDDIEVTIISNFQPK